MARYNTFVNSNFDENLLATPAITPVTSGPGALSPEKLYPGLLLPETEPSPGEEEYRPGNGSGNRFFVSRDTFYCLCEEHTALLPDNTLLRVRILWHSMDLCNWIETAQVFEQITDRPCARRRLDQKQADALILEVGPAMELRSINIWAVRNGVTSVLLPREKKRLRLPDCCAGCSPGKIRYRVPNA
ncbi:MAG: hypothetical protein RMJ43_14585 [Chloroherpetonaceae bacterium]|nr:hypothetical protein [Chthonomonadaceae bacterium]MDW8209059.1 hypothetical protein [Chloroherpetonaceae bacterium]